MSSLAYEKQWKKVLEGGQFTEEAILKLSSGTTLTVKGIFYSGTYAKDVSSVNYQASKNERGDYFQMFSVLSEKDYKNAILTVRGASFKVLEVNGALSETATLVLKPVSGSVL